MRIFFLIISMLLSTAYVFSQQALETLSSQLKDTDKYKFYPINVLKRPRKETIETTNVVLNMLGVDSISFYSGNNTGVYGDKAKEGLFVFHLKNYTPLINFNEFCIVYKIPVEDQNLPVFIDSIYAYKPKQTYFELGVILSVTISVEKSTGMRYLNIITLFPKPKHPSAF